MHTSRPPRPPNPSGLEAELAGGTMTRDTPCADALRWFEVRGAVEIQVGSLENPVASVGEP